MTSGSDGVEAQDYGPPDDGYPIVAQSGLLYENDSLKEAWSPSRKLGGRGSTATTGHCGLPEGAQIRRWTGSGESSSAYETVGVYFDTSSQIFRKI